MKTIRIAYMHFSRIVFCVLIVPCLVLLWPFRRVKFGAIREDRIGHLGPNTEIFLRRLQVEGRPKRTTYVFFVWNPANRQLLEMYKRVMPIFESRFWRRFFMDVEPILSRTAFHQPLPCTFKEHEIMAKGKPSLYFTQAEEEAGQEMLRNMGIGPDDWFVCFHARDSAYLFEREGFNKGSGKLDFRDCRIETYLDAAQWITDQGGFAIRMGAIVAKPLESTNPRIIDYAKAGRSDFMDIYLAARCRFWLGNGSGLNFIPLLFDVPTAIANFCPYDQVGFGPRMMIVPKLLWNPDEERFLKFAEAKALGLMGDWQGFVENYYNLDKCFGLEWRDSTSVDILDLAMDRFEALSGAMPSPEAQRLQKMFLQHSNPLNNTEYAGLIGPRAAIKYRHLIE